MMNQVVNSGPNMIYGTSNHMKSSTFAPNHPPATISDHDQLNQSSVTIHMYEDPRNLSGNSHYQLPSPVAIDVGPPPAASNGPTNGPYAATSITNNLTKVNCYNSNNNNNNENSPHGYHHQPNYNTLSSVKRSSQPRLRSAKSTGALYASTNVRRNGPGKGVSPSVPSTYLENEEVYQIERFYIAHKTFVYVSRCMANLYFTKTDLINEGRLSSPRSHEWQLERTGVPVIIFDKGETKARDKRKLQICLAERGTGFNLWNDIIDNLTDYKAVHPCFHTLYLSSDHRKVAGLSFDSVQAANEFLHQVEAITCDPVNIALSAPKRSNSKKEAKSKVKRHTVFKLPTKEAISSPCLFEHVTTVKIEDFDRLCSIASLVPRKVIASSANNSELRSLSSLNNTPCPPVASTSSSSMTSSENSSNFSI